MKSIRLPLYVGSIYFLLVSVVHAIGLKLPGLYIYFNVPSHAYQDRIISLLAFGWSVFFFSVAKSPVISQIKCILVIGFAALAMLAFNNLYTDFSEISSGFNMNTFHGEISILVIYWFWLLIGYFRFKQENNP